MEIRPSKYNEFLETLWSFYAHHGRILPWRQSGDTGHLDPYAIMVSELMLQQTQVARVAPKYGEFLSHFPTVQVLAAARLGDVLRVWQGLGYNRRAKFLWQAAQEVVRSGIFPASLPELVKLPGIGPNTAGAIMAYAYNRPALFVETNIRTVYIYHFFQDKADVTDKEIIALLNQTLDQENPREFYWALMDYGSYLKGTVGNLNKVSRHYAKQSTFHGSRRQIRGQIVRLLGKSDQTISKLQVSIPDERLESVLQDLVAEGMVHARDGVYRL